MADLPSILGGMAQGFVDFGKGVVDMFGTGGAAIGDLIEGARTGKVTTKNQDDFRKWLYQTDSVKDAAAKGLGTTLNGVQTVLDYIPGVNVLTRNPLGNAAQGALGGLADEFKTYGENYDLGRAGQRAAVSGAAAAASGSLADALKGSSNALLSSNTLQGLARGATGGAITGGGYAAIDGGDIMQGALQGAGTGALIGGATGAFQDFKPAKTYDAALTDDERAARIANAQKQIDDIGPVSRFSNNPDDIAKRARITELQDAIKAYQGGYDTTQGYTDAMAAKRANRSNAQSATTTQGQVYAPNMGEMEYGAPVQDGYTRLYRGMTQEFDPQYNRNAMDNMNGYESWTDSYDLANRYGDGKYVYSIDVPTSRIANSLFDENPNSATYGDRNFIAAIEKAAGLDGVDGNEYLLNTNDELRSGLTYNRVNAPKALEATLADADMAVNSPKITPEQEAYFKNSVMRDENGNLMPVYHSSPNKFTEFDDARLGNNTAYDNTAFGHFVTNDRDFSSRFKDIDNKGIDGYTMELYADVKNPITHPYQASGKYQGADLDNIVKRYYEATDNPEGLAAIKDWADESGQSLYGAYMDMTVDENPFDNAAAERDLLRSKGYDAVEFVEGLKDELVDGSTDKTPVSSYAVFRGNQLKDINNLAPTDAPNIMESRMAPEELDLGRTLAGQDMAVNGVQASKIAPGQLGLFDQPMPAKQIEEALALDGKYSPKDNKVTETMRARAEEIMGDYKASKKVPENELYNKIDESTLPSKRKSTGAILDDLYSKGVKPDEVSNKVIDQLVEKEIGGKMDKKSLATYLFGDMDDTTRKDFIKKNLYTTKDYDVDDLTEDILKNWARRKATASGTLKKYNIDNLAIVGGNKTVRQGYTGALDSALSERLGIAPGNTYKQNGEFDTPGALGRYIGSESRPDFNNYMVKEVPDIEEALNTAGHERLHSFQAESRLDNRYSKEVADAYNGLASDLKKANAYKSDAEIKNRYKKGTEYWGDTDEQEARMLQQYLGARGFTDYNKRDARMYGELEFDNDKIVPAFDKFFDKLRDLSKRGVALPALAALFGGGAYMASQENDKEKEVK